MRREGHFIENVWFKGGWCDEYQYALLEREWRGLRANGTVGPVATESPHIMRGVRRDSPRFRLFDRRGAAG